MDDKKKNRPFTKYAYLAGLGFEMAAIMFIFIWLGKWADAHYEMEKNIFVALGSLAGLAVSLFLVLRQLKNIQ